MSINKSFSNETSERYSRALFEVVSENKELDKVESEVKNIQLLISSSSEIKNFLKDPTQSINTQNTIISVISDKLKISKNLKNFFLLLVVKRRIFFVQKIMNSFLKLCSKKRGEIKAHLNSSRVLTQNELDGISKDLSNTIGSTIKLDYNVDESLIGGLKIQLGSFMIDTSIKNKLMKYKKALLEN